MMEGSRCEEIETSSEIESDIKTEQITEINSILYEKDGRLVELDSDLQKDSHAGLERIKYETPELAEEITTVYTEPVTLSETCEIPRSEQSLEFARIISEVTDYIPLSSLCRLCATPSNSMVYIFNHNELQNIIIEKIEYCFHIEVKKTDTLPKEICHLCLGKLELCYQFHKTVEAAEKQFLTFNDRRCNEDTYKSFFDQDAHGNIIKPQAILQELPKTDTETRQNSTILSNSMVRKAACCTNRPNKESRTESSSDKDQSTCDPLLIFPLHDMDEKLRFEINQSMKEEAKNDKSDDDIVEVFNKLTSAGKNIGHELIKCQNCRKAFGTVTQCLAHSSIHASKGYFPCCLCGAIFRTKKDCNKHSLEHKEGENVKERGVQTNNCNESLKKPVREAKLKAKIKLNSKIGSENKLHSKKCNEDIDSETSLYKRRQHMLIVHKQQKKSSHNICERELSVSEQPIALQRKSVFSFKCTLCNRRYRSKYELELHKKTDCNMPLVSTKKEFLCPYCKQSFGKKEHLKIHTRIHTRERPYDCDLCGKMFTRKLHRDTHRRIHTGEKPFKCSKCEKRCNTSSALKSHSLVHSDARPYNCHLCSLSFKISRVRDLHLRVHTGERPFKCSKCKKRFASSSSLRTHCGRSCKR